MPTLTLPQSALEMALVAEGDEHFPTALDTINLPLNRMRLAAFLAAFAQDKDVADLLALDIFAGAAGLPLSSTGLIEEGAQLALRPFRLWEYAWLYKSLGLADGNLKVLDLGGPASHVTILAALAGSAVSSVDLNPEIVRAAQECAQTFGLSGFAPAVGDMRDLSRFPDSSFDVVISCSVLEHLTAEDQELALRETARVLKPGGLVGLTFDFGPGAPGANIHVPPPHEPPSGCTEALRRYQQAGLVPVGKPLSEDPLPGSLFRDDSVTYTVASLVLAKPPAPDIPVPECTPAGTRVFRMPPIANLPYRLFAARQASFRQQEQAFADLRSQLEQTTAHAATLQAAADERLAVLQKTHESAAEVRTQLEARDSLIAELRQQLEEARQTPRDPAPPAS